MTPQHSKQKEENSVDLNKPFWKYKIHFNYREKRFWEEGVINVPITEKEARKMLLEDVGRRNNIQIVYLEKYD